VGQSGRERRASAVPYWALAIALIGFGVVAIFSIGLPFLALGLALVVLAPVRHRPPVFWPILSGVAAFFVGFVLVAPLTCTASAGTAVGPGGSPPETQTTCSSLLGIAEYTGTGGYEPPLGPGVAAGMGLAAAVALTLRLVLRRRTANPGHV
jgi:hypothetical protein